MKTSEDIDWRKIDGYGVSNYVVNQHGEIKNVRTNKLLSPFATERGYLRVHLGRYCPYVQRIVAEAFVGKEACHGLHIGHKDGDISNNSLDNLELM